MALLRIAVFAVAVFVGPNLATAAPQNYSWPTHPASAGPIVVKDMNWSTPTATSDCTSGWCDDSWSLTLTKTKDVTIAVADCCCPGDYFEVFIDGTLLGTTPNLNPPWGCSTPGPLSSGSFTQALCPGTYSITVRDAAFDGRSQAEITAEQMCPAGFTVSGTLADPDSGSGVMERISGFPSCAPSSTGSLMPTWGRFGQSNVLTFDSGDTLELRCVAGGIPWYGLYYTKSGGSALRVGVCPYEGGCNSGAFWHTGDRNKNGQPDCLLRTMWVSKDYGEADSPDPFTGDVDPDPVLGVPLLDWAIKSYDATTNNLTGYAHKHLYAVGPPVTQCGGSGPRPEGKYQYQRASTVDPPLGPQTEAFFDTVITRLQALAPASQSMGEDMTMPCDLDGDGDCDKADLALFDGLVGACLGTAMYLPNADANADGCITAADRGLLYRQATESMRFGVPPNVAALKASVTGPPIIGTDWRPFVDHGFFVPGSVLDILGITAKPINIVTPIGTLLGDFASGPEICLGNPTPAVPFTVRVPNDMSLVGASFVAQAASSDGALVALTNAIDITVGIY